MNDALYLRAVGIAAAVQPDYSFSLPAVRALARMGRLRLEKPVTFLVGENGTGKSTLLEAIAAAWGFNPEGGTRNFRFSTARTHAELYRSLVLQRGPRRPRDGFFLRAESFYNVATEIDRLDEIAPLKGAYGGRSLHEQSHGESFLALVLNRFSGSGLCTCWTYRRPLFRPRVSLRFWLLWTDWSAKIPSFSSPPIPRCFWRIRTPKFLF